MTDFDKSSYYNRHLLMSRKNNKSIKKRYNEFLKSIDRQKDQKQNEREYRRQEDKLAEEA